MSIEEHLLIFCSNNHNIEHRDIRSHRTEDVDVFDKIFDESHQRVNDN